MDNPLKRKLSFTKIFVNAYFLAEPSQNVNQTSKTLTFSLKMPTKTFL